MRSLAPLAVVFMCATACGSGEPWVPGAGETLFPLAVGNAWTFRVRGGDEIETKVQTITGTTANGGYVMRTTNGTSETVSVQRVEGTALVRESEVSTEDGVVVERVRFSPPSVRVDLMISELGASYEASFTEEHLDEAGNITRTTPKMQRFIIEAVDELIDVPAGEMRAVRVRRDTEGSSSKTYWYVRGVGKIREVGGQVEELSAWENK